MQITLDLRGHYEWAPPQLEPGTKLEITQADVTALRAKQMADDTWHLRVDVKKSQQYYQSIHEPNICQQMCGAVIKGEEKTRADVVVSEVVGTFKHHGARRHMVAVYVHDDGPDTDLMKSTMAEYGITGDAASELLAMYVQAEDVAEVLATRFKIKQHKEPNVAPVAQTKE
jgi:hypothetical protein